uniref:Legume lectin domain-containing protein n=1 Tax=Ananas comosus var. bracteatus TaxID=296719 RepID=A0A6V7QVP7_ANACO
MRISQLSSYLSFLFVVALVFVSAVRYSEAVEEKAEAPSPSPSPSPSIGNPSDSWNKPWFSTYFVFSISQRNGGSLAFSLTPSSASLESTDVLRSGTPLSPSLISVKFITTSDPTSGNRSANYVAIDVGAKPGVESSELSGSDLVLSSGQKLHSWIDYNGITKKIEVRVSKLNDPRPADLLLSHPIDLSNALWREKMLVAPTDPSEKTSFLGVFVAMVFAAALGALLMWYATVSRRPVGPMEYQMNPIEIGYERIVLLDDKVIREC